MDKMRMRRMAMDKMMGDGPSIAIKIKKKDPLDMSGMPEMGEEKSEGGYIQMAVTPAEKEMIMAARKEKPEGEMEDDSEESEEMDYA